MTGYWDDDDYEDYPDGIDEPERCCSECGCPLEEEEAETCESCLYEM